MADTFIEVPMETDPVILKDGAIDYIKARIANWQPADGDPMDVLLGAISEMAAENRDLASDFPKAAFRWAGANIFHVPPIDAAPASVNSTWTMKDNAGYTIPAETNVLIEAAGDLLVPFQVAEEVIVPPGSVNTAAGEVLLIAVEPGSDGEDLAGPATLQDTLDFVTNLVMVGNTTGGVDAEEDDVYLARLSQTLETLSLTPIVARDFAILFRTIPGVFRALALDNFNPADGTSDNPRMVAIAAIDQGGNPVSSAIKDAGKAMLQARRETNFTVNTMDPVRTTVDVDYEVVMRPGNDAATVEADVDAAIAAYLDPATWGAPLTGEAPEWDNQDKVRYLELSTVINNVDTVDYIVNLTLRKGADAFAAADVVLDGYAPLPVAGAVNGTVDTP
jgi:hypothetical protein